MVFIGKIILGISSLFLVTSVALSQDNVCLTIVQDALEAADSACDGIARNQACYGNITLEAEAQLGVTDFEFTRPGDVENIAGMKTLRLSPLDRANNEWGVALMRIQANLPDTVPGQNVTFLLFGNVEITNRVESNTEPLVLSVTAQTGANIRRQPSTDAPIIGSLPSGLAVQADGRLEDGSWLRIRLPEQAENGWVFTDLLTIDGDMQMLDVIQPSAPVFGPMQAFYFQTGEDDAPCAEAPDSGILIQTPQGAGRITLSVNDVDIQLGSTAYLQAQASGEMTVNILEGQARVEANGSAQFVPAGTRVRVPLDANLNASGVPTPPEPYDGVRLAVLPIGNLEQTITITEPLTLAQIQAAQATPTPTPPAITGGYWTVTETLLEKTREDCQMGTGGSFPMLVTPGEDGTTVRVANVGHDLLMTRVEGTNTYFIVAEINGRSFELTFTSPTTFTGTVRTLSNNWMCANNQAVFRWDGVAQ